MNFYYSLYSVCRREIPMNIAYANIFQTDAWTAQQYFHLALPSLSPEVNILTSMLTSWWGCPGGLDLFRLTFHSRGFKLYQGPSGHAHPDPSWAKRTRPAWAPYRALYLTWQDRNVGMCLQHDLDPVCTRGWCRGAQTGKPKPIHARRAGFTVREEEYSPYPSNILARFNNLPRVVFIFVSQCLWEPEDVSQEVRQQQSAAGNSWLSQTSLSDLPAAGSAECCSKAALSLAPVPLVLTLLYFRAGALSQKKVRMGRNAMRENWMKYFIPSSMRFVRRDSRLYPSAA